MAYKYTLPGSFGIGNTFGDVGKLPGTPSNGTPEVSTVGSYFLLPLLSVYVFHPLNL